MAGITLKKGLQPFTINFEDAKDEVTIYLNPTDSDLPKRLLECQKLIEEKAKTLKDFERDEDGTPNVDDAIRYFNDIDTIVYDAIDYAFGNKVSAEVFKHCGAFSVVNGEYFVIQFLQAIAPEIEKLIKENNKKAEAKANKYLAKYKKQ